MSIQVGERVPAGTLTRMTEGGPAPISTDDVFKGKKVVLFAVPGAVVASVFMACALAAPPAFPGMSISLHLECIEHPEALAEDLINTVGVVEHGLFLHMVDQDIVGDPNGPRVLTNSNK